ncbi:MAG: helix-turn-helix domain-containing protein, partial [Rhodospirillales bacterium]|nr:helix-turn-helix domain-containing protein [Rhodospirillales bacterium]
MSEELQQTSESGGENAGQGRTGVGALLRATRQRLNEDLRNVAQALRIRYVYLEAIEGGRYEVLPGTTYAVGFVRAYSDYLGLDSAEVVRRFKQEHANLGKRTALEFPVPIAERSVPGGAILLISAVLALVVYGGWYFLSSNGTDSADQVPSLPDRLAGMVSGNAETGNVSRPAENTEGTGKDA